MNDDWSGRMSDWSFADSSPHITERRVFQGRLEYEDEMHSDDAYLVLSDKPGVESVAYWQKWVNGLRGKRVRIIVEVLEEETKES